VHLLYVYRIKLNSYGGFLGGGTNRIEEIKVTLVVVSRMHGHPLKTTPSTHTDENCQAVSRTGDLILGTCPQLTKVWSIFCLFLCFLRDEWSPSLGKGVPHQDVRHLSRDKDIGLRSNYARQGYWTSVQLCETRILDFGLTNASLRTINAECLLTL